MPEPEEVTGTWYTKWGETYFVTEEGEALTGMQEIGEETYLFDDKGALERNVFYEEEGNKYYFDADGKMVVGWFDNGVLLITPMKTVLFRQVS